MSGATSHLWYHKTNGSVRYESHRPANPYRMLALRTDEKTSDTFPSSTKIVDTVKEQYKSLEAKLNEPGATDQRLARADLLETLKKSGTMLCEHVEHFIEEMMGTEWDYHQTVKNKENHSGDGTPLVSQLETQTLSCPASTEAQSELKGADIPARSSSDDVSHAHSDSVPRNKVSTTHAAQGTHRSHREIVQLVQESRVCKIETTIWKSVLELYKLAEPLQRSLEIESSPEREQGATVLDALDYRADFLDWALGSYQHMLAQVRGATQELAFAASLEELKQMRAYEDDDEFERALRQLSLEKDIRSDWSPSGQLAESLSTDHDDRAASEAGSPSSSEKEGMGSSVPVHSGDDKPANENEMQFYVEGKGRRAFTFEAFVGGGGKGLNWPLLENMITERVSRLHSTWVKGMGTRGDGATPSSLRDWCRSELPDE